MNQERISLDTDMKCLICEWHGMLRETTYSKTYTERSINHTYTCPTCGADIYNYTEDKPVDSHGKAESKTFLLNQPRSFDSASKDEPIDESLDDVDEES